MKARILVIEDEMSINDLLCMNLEIAGYETVGYLDGNEAYEAIIQDHAFQCALVDIMLPGRDGYSLLPKLKQHEIPVMQVKETTMIVGIDVGSEKHYFRAFNWRGIEFTRKPVAFSNSMEGFNSFYNTIVELMQKSGLEEALLQL